MSSLEDDLEAFLRGNDDVLYSQPPLQRSNARGSAAVETKAPQPASTLVSDAYSPQQPDAEPGNVQEECERMPLLASV